MSQYYTNELILELPPTLKDKTHHIFSLTDDAPSEFNLVITRSPISDKETLASYGTRLVNELERALPQFHLVVREEIRIDRQLAMQLQYTWSNQGAIMHQTQISFFQTLAPENPQVVQITATTTGTESEKWNAVFQGIVSSVRLRLPSGESGTDGPYLERFGNRG